MLAKITPFSGSNLSWPQEKSSYFEGIVDLTQDCDMPYDYLSLMFILRMIRESHEEKA